MDSPESRRDFQEVEPEDRRIFIEIRQLKDIIVPALDALKREKEKRLHDLQLKMFGKYGFDPENMPMIDGETWEIRRRQE